MTQNELISLILQVGGGLLAAFLAGSAIFYKIGWDAGKAACASLVNDLRARIRSLLRNIESLNGDVVQLRAENISLREKINAPPTASEADGLNKLLDRKDQDIWLAVPSRRGAEHDQFVASTDKRIISVIHLKGGTGKSTISANLAAYFDRAGKKVLLIDADYQGSLSDLMLGNRRESTAKIDEWLSSDKDPELLVRTANQAGTHMPNTSFVTAFYSLASVETKLMIGWLLDTIRRGEPRDLRYALSRILFAPSVQSRYDIAIIDCPPRLSTAAVNAICASTHLLIPSVPDGGSMEAVPNFTEMASSLTAGLNPSLRLAGIIPTLTGEMALKKGEQDWLAEARKDAHHFGGEPYIFRRNIPHKAEIANVAGKSIAYLKAKPQIRSLFGELGAEVAERIGL